MAETKAGAKASAGVEDKLGGRSLNPLKSRPVELVALWFDRLDRLGAYLAAGALVAMFGIVFSEVLLRSLFTKSTLIADEMASYLLAMMAFAAAGYTLRTGGHLSVTLLSDRLPVKVRKWVEVALTLMMLLCIAFLVLWMLEYVIFSFETKVNSQSQIMTPLWAPRAVVLLGATILGLALVSRLLRVLRDEFKP